MTESLMQQIQEAMNGGKMRAKRVKKAAKAVRKASPVRKPAAAKPKRRVVRRTPMKFMGGFFAELNNMVAGAEGGASDKKKAGMPADMPPVDTTGPVVMEGGRRFVYRKPVAKAAKKAKAAKAVAKKPRFGSRGRMSYGGYEEMEEQVEEQEQEGGRRKPRVVRRRRSASPVRRRAASPARRR